MKTRFLFSGALLAPIPLCAQLIAGEVPAGRTALDLNIDLQLNTANTVDSADMEIDCDDSPDLRAVLYRSDPLVDGTNLDGPGPAQLPCRRGTHGLHRQLRLGHGG